jgi:hypothetical protein
MGAIMIWDILKRQEVGWCSWLQYDSYGNVSADFSLNLNLSVFIVGVNDKF